MFEPVRERLAAWRERRQPGPHIPEEIWKPAVKLARQYGVSRTSRELRLGFRELRARVEREAVRLRANRVPAERFVEVSGAGGLLGGPECLIEVQSRWARIRIALNGRGMSEVAAVTEAVLRKPGR